MQPHRPGRQAPGFAGTGHRAVVVDVRWPDVDAEVDD